MVTLLRLCPLIPFNAFNYLMGITGIKVRDFAIGSIGMLPGTVVYVYIGITTSDVADVINGKAAQNNIAFVAMIIGSILACGGIVWISKVSRDALNEYVEEHQQHQEQ